MQNFDAQIATKRASDYVFDYKFASLKCLLSGHDTWVACAT